MELNGNTLFTVAKAAVLPIPTAIEAVVEAVASPSALPPTPGGIDKILDGASLPPAIDDPAAARRHASRIWAGGPLKGPNDPGPVAPTFNDIHAPGADPARDKDALNQVFANRNLEKAELAKLSPEDRKRYEDLSHVFDNDPQAHLALQMALLDGKFGPDAAKNPPNADGKKALEALTELSRAKVQDPPLHTGQVLGEVVRHIAEPGTIKQGSTNCCAAASLQVVMAGQQPAEYARLVTGLAKAEGDAVTLQGRGPNGQSASIKRVANWNAEEHTNDGTPAVKRTLTDRLFQNSAMDSAAKLNSPTATYDPVRQAVVDGGNADPDGLTFQQAGPLSALMQGTPGHAVKLDNVNTGLQKELVALFKDLQAGQQPTVEIGQHFDAKGNPQGPPLRGKVVGHEGDAFLVKGEDGQVRKYTDMELGLKLVKAQTTGGTYEKRQVVDAAYADVQAALAKQHQPVVMLRWGSFEDGRTKVGDGPKDPKHYVTVEKIEGNTVTLRNTQTGAMETMPVDEFKNRLCNVSARVD